MSNELHSLHSPPERDVVHKRDSRSIICTECPECRRETYHNLIHTLEKSEAYVEGSRSVVLYEFIQCRGCRSASMIHRIETGYGWEVQYYPAREGRQLPAWIDRLSLKEPEKSAIVNLLTEIYKAVNGYQNRLAAIGIRALIEQTMIITIGDHGSFKNNVDALHNSGQVSLVQRDALKDIIEAGHAAMHRHYVPEREDMQRILDVTEGVLQAMFVHPQSATSVADRVPPRTPSKPKT